jgi:hypothetical protein
MLLRDQFIGEDAENLGKALAEKMITQGAKEILQQV